MQKFKNFRLPGGPLVLILVVAIILGTSMFYTVAVDEVG
ncbi:MAG: HflK protein, partial [Opitutae bacterium]|nr:HflK protein [Opitutae bacterium]